MYNKDIKKKIYGYLTEVLAMRDYRRGWLKGNCPVCGKSDKFGVNLGLFRCNCFVCEYNPSPLKLILELEGLTTYKEVYQLLGSYDNARYIEPVLERIKRVDIQLPEGYTNITLGDSFVANCARNYIQRRGFVVGEVSLKGWGYCSKGDYFGYLIIPFYMAGKLVYYNARKFLGNGPRYKNPNIEDFGVGKSMIMYNADALGIYDKIYLAEGLFNADTVGEQAIACGGKKVSHYQVSMVMKSLVNQVVLILDPDAILDSIKLAMAMVFHKQVKIIRMPKGKDANDLGRDKILELEDNEDWLTFNDLLYWKHNYERPKFTCH